MVSRIGGAKESLMGGLSIWHILIVAIIAVLLFGGRGKISELMGDIAKGIKSFRQGLSEPDEAERPRPLSDQRRDESPVANKDQTVGR
jgi:sec-independent protein translocase protein TatA